MVTDQSILSQVNINWVQFLVKTKYLGRKNNQINQNVHPNCDTIQLDCSPIKCQPQRINKHILVVGWYICQRCG